MIKILKKIGFELRQHFKSENVRVRAQTALFEGNNLILKLSLSECHIPDQIQQNYRCDPARTLTNLNPDIRNVRTLGAGGAVGPGEIEMSLSRLPTSIIPAEANRASLGSGVDEAGGVGDVPLPVGGVSGVVEQSTRSPFFDDHGGGGGHDADPASSSVGPGVDGAGGTGGV